MGYLFNKEVSIGLYYYLLCARLERLWKVQ
jgi:hypothetical protein